MALRHACAPYFCIYGPTASPWARMRAWTSSRWKASRANAQSAWLSWVDCQHRAAAHRLRQILCCGAPPPTASWTDGWVPARVSTHGAMAPPVAVTVLLSGSTRAVWACARRQGRSNPVDERLDERAVARAHAQRVNRARGARRPRGRPSGQRACHRHPVRLQSAQVGGVTPCTGGIPPRLRHPLPFPAAVWRGKLHASPTAASPGPQQVTCSTTHSWPVQMSIVAICTVNGEVGWTCTPARSRCMVGTCA